MSIYTQQANQFAKDHNVKLRILDCEYKPYFDTDKESRYVFKCRLSRGKKSYTFNFGQSIRNGSKEPEMYDVLSCLEKTDVGTFQDFCDEFGYDTDSKRAERIYKAVVKEYKAVERLFGDCIEELYKIN